MCRFLIVVQVGKIYIGITFGKSMKYHTNRGEKIYEDGSGAPDDALLRMGQFVLIARDVYDLRSAGKGKLYEAYSMKTLHTSEGESPITTVEIQPVIDKQILHGLTQMVLGSQTASYSSTHARRTKVSKRTILDDTSPNQDTAIRHLEDL